MSPNMIVSHSKNRLILGVRGALVGLALIVVGYGIVKAPEHSLPMTEASASAHTADAVSVAGKTDATPAVSPAPAARSVSWPQPNPWVDAPRECEPDKGIADACIYN
jgi:hypothetical protein